MRRAHLTQRNGSVASAPVTLIIAVWLLVTGCTESSTEQTTQAAPAAEAVAPAAVAAETAMVDDARINAVDEAEPGAWLTYGRTYEEQRFSPLTQIDRDTVGDLGVVWHKDLDTIHPVEATPLVIDGVMYFTTPWNITYALDAATGEEIWTYDPEVPGPTARQACCGVISRGVAAYQGRIYVATLDARLIALDATTGEPVWEVNTKIDPDRDYTITGAPRVAAGKVFIGNGGAELGVRGYVTAYDAETGEEVWRFFTVPGDPSQPFEHPEMELAAETWKGGNWWEIGGGGTVWNSIVYDPDFHTVYLGVGNGSPWTRAIRSPGGGDNLFLASIVALDADTGRMKWYYQTTPGDNWDYTAVQDMMLADVEIDGEMKKVLMQAPKNGFFYVLDRSDGSLLRAHPYATVTWATHVDMETGRPVENTDKAYANNPQWILPGPTGAHNWQAMAWNAEKNLMYLTTHDLPFLYAMPEEYQQTGIYKRRKGMWNTAVEFARLNQMTEARDDSPDARGFLTAFNPITGETAWEVEMADPWNGGVVFTAGGLVFHGNATGKVVAYNSDTGEALWEHDVYASIVAPPITYELDGVQYVAILTGSDSFAPEEARATYQYGSIAKAVVFAIGGSEEIPVPKARDLAIPEQPALTASAEDINRGDLLYHDACQFCHGGGARSGGAIPDLRMMSKERHDDFLAIVLGGMLQDNGMASFADILSAEDAERIRQYIISRAIKDRQEAQETAATGP